VTPLKEQTIIDVQEIRAIDVLKEVEAVTARQD